MVNNFASKHVECFLFPLTSNVAGRVLAVIIMSVATSFLLFLYFLPYSFAGSCSNSKFTCANLTIDIRYPFFTNRSLDCHGVYLIHCINLTPMIQFPGQEFMYPVLSISYPERTLIIHDLKLSLSSYPWGPDCVFLYNFKAPIPHVNVTHLSLLISSGQPLFNCGQKDYGVYQNIFYQLYNASLCKDYDLYYTHASSDSKQNEGLPAPCASSGLYWFGWKLLFSEYQRDTGNFSLLSVGFSRNWTLQLDCFDCRVAGDDCRSGGDIKGPACKCSQVCRGITNAKKKAHFIIAGVVAAAGGFVLACFLWYGHRKRQRYPPCSPLIGTVSSKLRETKLGSINYPTHVFTYSELHDATDSFDASQELGDGGFATVYKGKLRDGRTVAVKRLYENNYKRVEQFINEVAILSRLRHKNLVTLYGCTSHHSRDLLLVYEFVPNSTVADHLHGQRAAEGVLTWPLRMSIAIETAEALAYLHGVEPPIIHRDVKTSNILLDDSFHVKVADFGLSRLFPIDATHVSTAPQGTPGYLDPQYHHCYQLTDKSDVYSFGVVLVELISSKLAVDISRKQDEINLAAMALNKIRNKELEQMVDPGLGYQSNREMRRMISLVAELAFRCLQMDRDMRPPIKEVLDALKEIESNGCKAVEADVWMQDDTSLLKNTKSFSPEWASSCSTNPNSIGSGTI